MSSWDSTPFSSLVGKTMKDVRQIGDERIAFECDDGKEYALYHQQDCCESVSINDVCGDLADLVGSPILLAEEAESSDDPPDIAASKAAERAANPNGYYWDDDSQTWTFYKLATLKGRVTIRWHGSSNGYYSESVTFAEVK